MPAIINAAMELVGIRPRPRLPPPVPSGPGGAGPLTEAGQAIGRAFEHTTAFVSALTSPLKDFMQNNYTNRAAIAVTNVAAPAIRFVGITGAADAASQYVQYATYRYLHDQSEEEKQKWFTGLAVAGVGLMVLTMVAQRVPGMTRQQANKVKDASRIMSAALVSALFTAAKLQGVPADQAGAGLAGSITYPLVRDETEAMIQVSTGRDVRNLDRWQASAAGVVTFMLAQFGTAELRNLWGASGGLQLAIDGKEWGETLLPTLKHAIIHPLGEFAPWIAGTVVQAYYDKLGPPLGRSQNRRTFAPRNPMEDRALDQTMRNRGLAGVADLHIGVELEAKLGNLLDAALNPAAMRIDFIHALVLANLIKQTAGGFPIADENLRGHIDNLTGAGILGLLAVLFEGGLHHEPVRENLRYQSEYLRGQPDNRLLPTIAAAYISP